MSLLTWDKPPKARQTAEHNEMHQSDTNIAGTYVPNMSDEWQRKWKAKHIGGADPRVEIRVTVGQRNASQVLIVVRKNDVKLSTNGPIHTEAMWFMEDLPSAIDDARKVLEQ